MRLSHWFALIGVLVTVGCLQVAQHNAIFLSGYAVGQRRADLHTQQNELSWLNAQVVGLTSPTHLAEVAQDRGLKLVAWSTWPRQASFTDAQGHPSTSLVHVASLDPAQAPAGDEGSD